MINPFYWNNAIRPYFNAQPKYLIRQANKVTKYVYGKFENMHFTNLKYHI